MTAAAAPAAAAAAAEAAGGGRRRRRLAPGRTSPLAWWPTCCLCDDGHVVATRRLGPLHRARESAVSPAPSPHGLGVQGNARHRLSEMHRIWRSGQASRSLPSSHAGRSDLMGVAARATLVLLKRIPLLIAQTGRDVASCRTHLLGAAASLLAWLRRATAAPTARVSAAAAIPAAGSAPSASHRRAGCAGAARRHALRCRAGRLCAEQDRGHW